MGEGILNETLRRVAKDWETRGIDYSLIGVVALNQYGYRRFTEAINLLLTREGLERYQKDLADVQELIKIKNPKADFVEKLNPFVREKFLELQKAVSEAEE